MVRMLELIYCPSSGTSHSYARFQAPRFLAHYTAMHPVIEHAAVDEVKLSADAEAASNNKAALLRVQSQSPQDALPPEVGGPEGPEPTRYGDWEKAGRCIDF